MMPTFKIFPVLKKFSILPLILSGVLFLFLFNSSFADISTEQQKEIDHLLKFITESACQFKRNGRQYSGIQSRKHIQKKYNYFNDTINSAEDFIQYSATKSTMSGQYYTVNCPNNKKITSKEWLLKELQQFRSEQK